MNRVTPPAQPIVTVADMAEHLRLTHDADLAQVEGWIAAATAHLDGYRGVLGRAIMPQSWALDLPAGKHRLPLPDVTGAVVDVGDVTLSRDALGWVADLTEGGTVTFTAALPEDALPVVQGAVKLWVEAQYDRLTGPDRVAYDRAIEAMIAPVRWTRCG